MSKKNELESGNPETAEAPAAGPPQELLATVLDESMVERVHRGARARTEEQKKNAERMVEALIQQIVEGYVQRTEDIQAALDVAIARLDALLTQQLNPVIHHEQFQKVEAAWRGLHYFVHQSNTSQSLKIKVLDVSRKDLSDDLMKASDYDQSGLFKAIYEHEYGMPGGQPYGALIGDMYFSNSNPDMALLEKVAQVAAAAHAPFIASAGPEMFGMETFTELMDPRDLSKRFEGPDYARWNSFREKPESCYVGLTQPRVLGRLPYGKENPLDSNAFDFTEHASLETHDNYLWTNAAYAFGARLTAAFDDYGWCAAIVGANGGGRVEGVPLHTFKTDDGTVAAKCPTEIAITDRRDSELDRLGFIPLCHYKNTDYAVFFAAQSANKPQEFIEDAATSNARLMSMLPYTMVISRFAHYLKVMQRDNIGLFRERADVERELKNWIGQYVLLVPNAGQDAKASRPLSGARIEVVDVPGEPGHYTATMWLRPHFMMIELDVDLRLVAELDQGPIR